MGIFYRTLPREYADQFPMRLRPWEFPQFFILKNSFRLNISKDCPTKIELLYELAEFESILVDVYV